MIDYNTKINIDYYKMLYTNKSQNQPNKYIHKCFIIKCEYNTQRYIFYWQALWI